jgi:peptidoglycan/xylan/chitin deacetylase (PgdA/CDA1 family)
MASSSRFVRAVGRIVRTRYPRFLFGLPLARAEIPVFTYHEARPEEFARDLEYLADNGYRTLSLEEFFRESSAKAAAAKSVLLTFDDARKSVWESGVPLLRKFKARATLFVPSFWMDHASLRDGASSGLFMTWDEVRGCVESGLVDVQSHAHRHALVNVSDSLLGFASPQDLVRYDIYDWPMRSSQGGEELGYPELGTPVYSAAPLLSAPHRFIENSELARTCQNYVSQKGGADFYRAPDWRRQLERVYARARVSGIAAGRRMPDAEFRKLLASEFEQSRARFSRHLGYEPKYLAYPWMLGSRYSMELARDFGMKAVFGVALDYRKARDRSLPLPVFGRLKADWLPLLPGRGRASLTNLLLRKVADLSKNQNLAH